MIFPVVVYECEDCTVKKAECKGTDAFKLWCWRRLLRVLLLSSLMLEKTLESPLDSKEIKPVNPKGNQPWILIGKIDVEAETPILWPPDAKSQLIGKDSDAGKDWGQEKGMTEDQMVGWHHRLNGHEFEQFQEDSEGQGSLVCCCPWSLKESDMTEQLNWTERFSLANFYGILLVFFNL